MKTTFDLPRNLIDEVQLHAQSSGVDRDHAAADLLRLGLSLAPAPVRILKRPVIETDPETGFPLIKCSASAPARQMTVDQLIAIEQATQTQDDLERAGVFDRHECLDRADL
jgi:hypothetical protein